MKRSAPSTRYFLSACGIVVVGAVVWRIIAPQTAQGPAPVSAQSSPPPTQRSIIVFETDDQRADTLPKFLTTENDFVMPNVHEIFVENGVSFTNAFVTNPTCCPSRASQLSGGFYSHNTGVLTNTWPNGGAERFKDTSGLAMRMRAKGYYNALIGKYMNQYEQLLVPGGSQEKARYIPPGWDLFIVVSDARDWDDDYKITIGSHGASSTGPVEGIILPDDVCLDEQGDGTCDQSDNHWENDDETGKNLEEKLLDLGISPCVIEQLRDVYFPYEPDEDERSFRYLPEMEFALANALLTDCPGWQDPPDWEETPLFAMFTMAPPHGPTQLDYTMFRLQHCNNDEVIACDGSQNDYASQEDDYSSPAFGEGTSDWDEISDKPTWMQGNPDVFEKYVDCDSCLLECYRGTDDGDACDSDACFCDDPDCPDYAACSGTNDGRCRHIQQVFKDELGALHIIDCFVGQLKSAADSELGDKVFFFTSDHGTFWGEHGEFQKGSPYEEAIRVPFAVAGDGIRFDDPPIVIDDQIAMDLDMPATILEIAGYTRDQISNPGISGLIKSDGCSLLGILEAGADWGACYSNAPDDILPRESVLIQSFRNLAPNSTPCFAGLRLEADTQEPLRKHVITDTHEHEYYDLDDDEFELDNLVCMDPSEIDDRRTEIASQRGLVITLDDPSIVDWDLPMGIPDQAYSVTFKAEGGVPSPSVPTYTWCLWDFSDGTPTDCDECSDPDDLGCLFAGIEPNDGDDCSCTAGTCPCECGYPGGFQFTQSGATATLSGTYPSQPSKCYEFILAVMDGSVSRYTGQPQKYLRRFRIQTGYQLPEGQTQGSYFTYASEDGQFEPDCQNGESKLVVRKEDPVNETGNVALLRFARPAVIESSRYRGLGGELILRADDDLLDATLYYFEKPGYDVCKLQYDAFPDCASADWADWADSGGLRDHAVPIARICSIQAEQYVRFDISPYVTKRYLDCVKNNQNQDYDQNAFYQFVITSNETTGNSGFYGSNSAYPPRLAFTHTTLSTPNENNNEKCSDCRDNDCDEAVDCDDGSCDGTDPCNSP